MERTQLQMRVETTARTGKIYPAGTYFVDTRDYRNRPFVEGVVLSGYIPFAKIQIPLSRYLSEQEVKSERCALQARLAHMGFEYECADVLQKYAGRSGLKRTIGNIKLNLIRRRNYRLMEKAVSKAMKIKGVTRGSVFRQGLCEFIAGALPEFIRLNQATERVEGHMEVNR